ESWRTYARAAAASAARGERRSATLPSASHTFVARTSMSSPRVARAGERDRDHDDDSGGDLPDPVGGAEMRASVLDGGHEERAHGRACDRALAARERAAADDDRGDDLELEAHRVGGISDRQGRELHDPREAGERRAERVHVDLHALDRHAAEARRLL